MNEELYNSLNNLSNNEFEDILHDETPIEKYLNILIQKKVLSYNEKINENNYKIKTTNNEDKEVFVKYITLVDFLKFLIGKYKNDNLDLLPGQNKEINEVSKYYDYINDTNNYAYVDSFFYYLTSILKDKYNFIHGIECYDSFVCKKKNCKINIADDFEYLCDSNYFNENMNKLFYFDDNNISEIFEQTKKEKIDIMENIEINGIDPIEEINNEEKIGGERKNSEINDLEEFELNFDNLDKATEPNEIPTIDKEDEDDSDEDEMESIDINPNNSDNEEESDDDSEGSSIVLSDEESEYSNSEESNQDKSNSEDDSDEDEDEDEDDSDQDEDEEVDELYLRINQIPTQVVILEKCENTLDYLLENDLIKIEELESCIFQILVMLHSYQKIFKFTHNDLHTNNIMYIETEETYLYYKINNITYKVPSYGKIYKIIDFGRSIYYYNNKLLCSDSFSSNGTAHTQYNFEPYYNSKKPIIMPNYSFDLCRLSCSLFDFICDDIQNIDDFRNEVPIYDLIFSWIYDDNNRNVLYKSNGEDKYPGFKLYKMISKLVHNHIPEKQFSHKSFEKYVMNEIDENIKETIMDLDNLFSIFSFET